MSVGENIKIARKNKHLTQNEFANLLSINSGQKIGNTTISNWELGVSSPDIELLPYMCGILDVDANFLFSKSSSNEYDEQTKKIATDNGVEISYAKEKELNVEDVLEVNKILMEELSKDNKN